MSARLSLPGLAADAESRPWAIRAVDLDVLGHVNNAAQWAILEEALVDVESDRNGVAEIEYLAPVDAADSPATLHLAGSVECLAWLFAHDTLCTIARWRPTRPAPQAAPGARHRENRYCPRRTVSVARGDAALSEQWMTTPPRGGLIDDVNDIALAASRARRRAGLGTPRPPPVATPSAPVTAALGLRLSRAGEDVHLERPLRLRPVESRRPHRRVARDGPPPGRPVRLVDALRRPGPLHRADRGRTGRAARHRVRPPTAGRGRGRGEPAPHWLRRRRGDAEPVRRDPRASAAARSSRRSSARSSPRCRGEGTAPISTISSRPCRTTASGPTDNPVRGGRSRRSARVARDACSSSTPRPTTPPPHPA